MCTLVKDDKYVSVKTFWHFGVHAITWVNGWAYPREVHCSLLVNSKEFIDTVEKPK